MDLLSVASTGSIIVSLHQIPISAQELEVNLVLGLVPFHGGEVDVEIEPAGVTLGALYEGAESAVEEPRGGPPPCTSAVVIDEGYGIGIGAVSTGIGSVVDGDLFEGLGFVVWRSLWVESWVRHLSCRWWRSSESGDDDCEDDDEKRCRPEEN